MTNVNSIRTMDEFFKALEDKDNTKAFYRPRYEPGCCKTIKEFFEKIIDPTLPKKETLIAWNKLLNEYINLDDMILFIRAYASSQKKNGSYDLRRGFLTKLSDGTRYTFCDNYFPQFIYLMAINNFVPEIDDFKNYMTNFKMPISCHDDGCETPYQVFHKGPFPKVNENRWKLSHMFSAKKDDYEGFNFEEESAVLFPKGELKDWEKSEEKGFDYPIRLLDVPKIPNYKEKIKAHFIRICNPLNYFLTPSANFHKYDYIGKENKDIGENDDLIQYVYLQLEKIYGSDLLLDFKTKVMGKMDFTKTEEELGKRVINVNYGIFYGNPKGYTNEQAAQCLYDFIFLNTTIKSIAEHVFGSSEKQTCVNKILTKFNGYNLYGDNQKNHGLFEGKLLEDVNEDDIENPFLKSAITYIKENLNKDFKQPENVLKEVKEIQEKEKKAKTPKASSAKTTSTKTSTPAPKSEVTPIDYDDAEQIALFFYLYLFKNLSLSKCEQFAFEIMSGHGYVGQKVRDTFGISDDDKGCLSNYDIDNINESIFYDEEDNENEELQSMVDYIKENLREECKHIDYENKKPAFIPRSQRQKTPLPLRYSECDVAKCLYAFLFEGKGLRNIEIDILGKDNHGTTAQNCRNWFFLSNEHRGCLNGQTLNSINVDSINDIALQDAVMYIKEYKKD